MISIESLGSTGACYFWSLLSGGFSEWSQTLEFEVESDPEDTEQVELQDLATDAEDAEPVRKRRIEERHPDIVSCVRDFILSKGQGTQSDCHRLRSKLDVFGAPLSALVKYARPSFPVSRSAIYNLLAPPRKNAASSQQRALINARPIRTVAGVKKFHARGAFSAALSKYHQQFLTMVAGMGLGNATEYAMHDMTKVPMIIPARPGSSPKGFAIQRSDGHAAFAEFDHSFPVAGRMLMSTSGVSACDVPTDASPLPGPKPTLRTSQPDRLYLFVRPHRYNPVTAEAHMIDLYEVSEREERGRTIDISLTTADNGPDYSIDVSTTQHLFWHL